MNTELNENDVIFVLSQEDPAERHYWSEFDEPSMEVKGVMGGGLERNAMGVRGKSAFAEHEESKIPNEEDMQEMKQPESLAFGSKKAKGEFFEALEKLKDSIRTISTDIRDVHKRINKKSSNLINHITKKMERIIEEVANEEQKKFIDQLGYKESNRMGDNENNRERSEEESDK